SELEKSRSGFPSLLSRHKYSSWSDSPRKTGHVNLLHHISELHGPSVQDFYLFGCAVGACTYVLGRSGRILRPNITGKKGEKQRLIHGIGEPGRQCELFNITTARGIE